MSVGDSHDSCLFSFFFMLVGIVVIKLHFYYRSLVKIWEREASTKQMNGGYSALDANFSCGLGGIDPGGDHVKHEPGAPRNLYPNSVNHPHQGGKSIMKYFFCL